METSYVDNFIKSLGMNDECEKLARVLFKHKKDCDDFYIGHLGRNTYVIDDLLDYREVKLSIADMSFDKFHAMCDNRGIKESFEHTFLYHFDSQAIRFIESLIKVGKTSIHEIHSLFVKNPNVNILKNVL